MFKDYDATANVLAFTDKDVAADWRNGMLRATATLIIEQGKADGATPGSWGSFNGFRKGSLAEHFYDNGIPRTFGGYDRGHGSCAIVSVTNIQEDSETVEDCSTFDASSHSEVIFQADVTCEHGATGKMIFSSGLGDIIGTIAQATS